MRIDDENFKCPIVDCHYNDETFTYSCSRGEQEPHVEKCESLIEIGYELPRDIKDTGDVTTID